MLDYEDPSITTPAANLAMDASSTDLSGLAAQLHVDPKWQTLAECSLQIRCQEALNIIQSQDRPIDPFILIGARLLISAGIYIVGFETFSYITLVSATEKIYTNNQLVVKFGTAKAYYAEHGCDAILKVG